MRTLILRLSVLNLLLFIIVNSVNGQSTVLEPIQTNYSTPLSGNYLVGQDATCHFPNLDSAVSTLEQNGVNGPVNILIKQGSYYSSVRIGPISGTSSSSQLTIESYNSDPNSVELHFAASSTNNNYVLKLDSCNYVNIKYITIKASGINDWATSLIINGSNNCNIIGNNILNVNNTASNLHAYRTNVMVSSSSTFSNITLKENSIKNGYTGISVSGQNTSIRATNTIIEDNTFINNNASSVSLNYTNSYTIKGNTISNLSNPIQNGLGIYIYQAIGDQNITKNKVSTISKKSLSLYLMEGTNTSPVLVANNFLYQADQTSHQVYMYSCEYMNFYNNSLHSKGNNSTYSSLYLVYGDDYSIYNNNIINNAGGKALYVTSANVILGSDYNNYFTTGTYLAYWGTNMIDLPSLKVAANGKETNSISNNTPFYSDNDLHVYGNALNGKGITAPGVLDDIDGETRSLVAPDIGADEFSIYSNDAALTKFVNLYNPCTNTAQAIQIKINNYGITNISNLNVGWSINGVIQTPYTWTGSLSQSDSSNITIGNYSFSSDSLYEIKAWVNTVNLVTDSNTTNNILIKSNYKTKLVAASYRVGVSTLADFNSIPAALQFLVTNGVCGPVFFNLEDGIYNGVFNFPLISGTNRDNIITFQSLSKDSATTKIINNLTTYNNLFTFDNSGYYSFKNLSLISQGAAFSKIFSIKNNSRHIYIDSCNLIGNVIYYTDTFNTIIDVGNSSQFSITNSTIKNGNIAINISGNYNNLVSGINIKNNKLINFENGGIIAKHIGDTLEIHNNTIIGYNKGIFTQFTKRSVSVKSNNIKIEAKSGIGRGIYMRNHNESNTNPSYHLEISNNFVDVFTPNNFTSFATVLVVAQVSFCDIYFNTLKFRNPNDSNSSCFHLASGDYLNFKNNIMDTENNYALNIGSPNPLNTSDYNSFYSTRSTPIYCSGNQTFSSYKTNTSLDLHSKWHQPLYLENNDLHIHDTVLNGAGTPISIINNDIDGDARPSIGNPDIGADEFIIFANDIQLYSLVHPNFDAATGVNPVKVALRNMGTSNVTSDSLHYSLNNGAKVSIKWIGNLAPLAISSSIVLGSINLTPGNHTLKVWSSSPNHITDLNTSNDTIEIPITVLDKPTISINPNSITGTTIACNDSVIIPVTIKNTGGLPLNYSIDLTPHLTVPLKLIVLTYGDAYNNYIINSMQQPAFSNYIAYSSNASTLAGIQSAIVGMDVIVVSRIYDYYTAPLYSDLAATFQNFVNNGGTIIFAGQTTDEIITNTGLWPNFSYSGYSSSTYGITLENSIITDNITSSDLSASSDYYYYFHNVPKNYVSLIKSYSRHISGYFPYGKGKVFYLGFGYSGYNKILQSKVINNSLKYIYYNRTSWLSTTDTSGTLNGGDSAIVNIKLSSAGYLKGIYTTELNISSNDVFVPNILVPCTLNIVGTPDFTNNDSIVNFITPYNNIPTYDSVAVVNTGCGDLIINGISTTNTVYSVESYNDTILAGDSTYIVYKCLSTLSGTYNALSIVSSNAGSNTISLNATSTEAQAMTATPSILNAVIPSCNDTAIINLQIQNTGGGSLNAKLIPTSDSAHIIILTYGSTTTEVNNNINTFNDNFSKFDYFELNSTNASLLQSAIVSQDANVIVIPFIQNNKTNSYASLALTLQTFVDEGGTVIFTDGFYDNIFNTTGLISAEFKGQIYGTITTVNTNDEITYNFSTTVNSNNNDFCYFSFNEPGITSLMKYGNRDVCVRKNSGAGQILVLGYRDATVSNTLKSVATGANWMNFSTVNSSLISGSSVIRPITFNSSGLTTGIHTASLKVFTNQPINPIVYIPCTLNVQNQLTNSVDLGNDTVTCSSITLDAGTNATYLWSTGSVNQTISVSSTGTYSVTVNGGSACMSTDNITVTKLTSSSISITGLASTACTADGNITLTGSPAGGLFIGPGVTGNVFNPAISGIGTHNIIYNYNLGGCNLSTSQTITVSSAPTVSFIGLDASYCPSDPVAGLAGTPSGGTFSGDGILGNIFYPSLASLGNHDIVYSFTNTGGCTNSDTNTVFIGNTSISINIIMDTIFCIGDMATTIFANPAGGTLSGNGISNNIFNPNLAGVGTHYIKYLLATASPCAAIDSIKVVVGEIPSVNAGNNLSLDCNSSALSLGQQAINSVSYSWTPTIGLSDPNISNPLFTLNASINYTLTATHDLSGCSNTDDINIQVTGSPIISLSNDTLICPNSPVTLTATGGNSYLWSNGLTSNTIVVSPLLTTPYYVIVGDTGCYSIDTVWINVSNSNLNLGADTSICSTQTITLDAGTGSDSYIWSNGSTNQTIMIDSTGIGIGSITLDVEVANNVGCIDKDTITITFIDCTGLNNVDNNNFIISIYPNPTKGLFTLSSSETNIDKLKLEILDINGRIIYKNQIINTTGIITEKIDLSHRAKGIYLLRLTNENLIKTFKVIVQ